MVLEWFNIPLITSYKKFVKNYLDISKYSRCAILISINDFNYFMRRIALSSGIKQDWIYRAEAATVEFDTFDDRFFFILSYLFNLPRRVTSKFCPLIGFVR